MQFSIPTLLGLASSAMATTGRMTYYDPGLGACGIFSTAGEAIVALGHDLWTAANPNNDPLCGKTITINYGGQTATARVVDKCMSCTANDIDVSPTVFQHFAELATGVVTVEWNM